MQFGYCAHITTVIIPKALAFAEIENANLDAFLQVVRITVEITSCVGLWLGRNFFKFWYQFATFGTFGAVSALAIFMNAL